MQRVRPRVAVAIVGASAFVAAGVACAGGSDTGGGLTFDAGGTTDVKTVARDGSSGDAAKPRDGGLVIMTGKDAGRDAPSHVDAVSHAEAATTNDAGEDTATSVPEASIVDVIEHHDTALPQVPVVYGQSADVLYSLDPDTDAVTVVGIFTGCDSDVIDIALDKDSKMYATTFGGVYTINTSNAACTLIATGTTYPNSLSFVPAGTLDPTEEALVGYEGSTYVRINTTTGAMTSVGSLGGTYTSSGDIVSVIGGGTYLTVTGGSNCSTDDCLVEVNPATGALITNYGSVKHAQVYGLAFWAGNLYGFDNGGDLFEVSFPDAGGLGIKTIPIPDAPFGLSFYGAGSTTAAPKR